MSQDGRSWQPPRPTCWRPISRVTLDGEVFGINVAGTSQAENIGFAVAIDAAKSILQQALVT